MYLLTRQKITSIIPEEVLSLADADDWDRVLAWPVSEDQKAHVAVLCMDAGHAEGVRRLLQHGLSANATVSSQCLRQSGYPSRVSLLRLAADLAAPSVRDGSCMPFIDLLLRNGAKPDMEGLKWIVSHGDTEALDCYVRHAPGILKQARRKISLHACLHSPEMMECLLDHGVSSDLATEWLWSTDLDGGQATVGIMEVLARRGISLDGKYPFKVDGGRGDRSLLEYHVSPASLVDPDEEMVLAALVALGARIDRLDHEEIHARLPVVAAALDARLAREQAEALQECTHPSSTAPRSHRL